MPPFDADLQALTAQLTDAYSRAWQQVVAEQQAVAQGIIRNPRLWRQRDRLAEMRQRIEHEMQNLDVMAEAWVTREYPKFYMRGAEKAATALHSDFTWTQGHRDALVLLVKDAHDDLLEATAFVREDTKRFIRQVSKVALDRGQLMGRTARQTAAKVAEFLQSKGITSVVYANGARHGLADYADMMVRTKTAVAYNVGTLNQGAEFGVKYYEVFDGPSCGWSSHDDIDLANGKIVSAKEAATFTIAHPRCARSFGPRPDITTPVVAKGAKPTAGGQHLDRPEAAQFPLEAAARTKEAREAAGARRAAAGLQGRVRTPERVLARRAAMLQRGPGAAARGESGLHPQSRRKAKEPPTPTDPFGTQAEGFDDFATVMDRAWANQGETQHLAWDGGSIEDLQLRITRAVLDGEEKTLVQFKLREDAKTALEHRVGGATSSADEAREAGRAAYQRALAEGKPGAEAFRLADEVEKQLLASRAGGWTKLDRVRVPRMNRGVMDMVEDAYTGHGTTYLSHDSWKAFSHRDQPYVRFIRGEGGNESYAFDGLVQAFLPGKATPQQLAQFMDSLGVTDLGYPKPSDAFVYVRNRLGELFRVNRHSGRIGEVEVEKALEGAKRVFGVDAGMARLAPGHGGRVEVHLDPAAVRAIIDKTRVRAFTHSLSEYDPEGIASIIESGALKSTSVRWTEGIGKAGQSSSTDVVTGGADYVFTRHVSQLDEVYSPTFVLDAEEMLPRTDWFAYTGDRYGAQNPRHHNYVHDVTSRDNLRNLSGGIDRGGQETMFKHRVAFGPKTRLHVNDSYKREQILEALRRRGVTDVAGTPIDKFVVVGRGR